VTRIWITGAGLVTALGVGVETNWARLCRGERAIGKIDLFETTGMRSTIGAQVRVPLDAPREAGAWSRTTAMALLAANEALGAAGLAARGLGARAGLVVAGTTGGMLETEELLARFYADPGSREVLAQMLSHPLTATGDRLEEELGPFSRARTLSSACSGGANALVVAATWLRAGVADVVVAGASDALCRLTFSGFNALAALDVEPCRPFDARRKGLSLGEGAGFVVLEREEHARARGKKPLAELAGWAIGSEAHHITNPEATGATPARLISTALARAGLTPPDVGYVNAHGTGTPLNDPMEARALHAALGRSAASVLVSSAKGQIGHTLGAAGAIEAIVTALAVARKEVPPTGGLETPDPECALAHVMGEGRAHHVRAAVTSSFGFGGMDAVLVLAEPGFAPPPRDEGARRVVVTGCAAATPAGLSTADDAARLLEVPPSPPGARIAVDPARHVDLARARRLDRAARLGVMVASRALGGAAQGTLAGVVLGSAFGGVDGSAAYMHRLFEKGPRMVSPADFPNLVPSSPVGHASIYLDVQGPALAVSDLGASGEAAIAQAYELVAAGEADRVVAGAVEEASDIVERVLSALFGSAGSRSPRSEGVGALALEAEELARERGARILARVEALVTWRDPAARLAALSSLPAPRATARVVAAHDDGRLTEALAGTPWAACVRAEVASAAGDHEALGAVAACAAASLLAGGDAKEALVVSAAPRRGYALLMVAESRASSSVGAR
jgi:3-oxoacyl-[acyl-carrier-protein] synthase II